MEKSDEKARNYVSLPSNYQKSIAAYEHQQPFFSFLSYFLFVATSWYVSYWGDSKKLLSYRVYYQSSTSSIKQLYQIMFMNHISEFKQNIKRIGKHFNWHLFPQPKDKPIESFYEIACFVLLLLFFLFLYVKCNETPYYTHSMRVECLNNRDNTMGRSLYIHPIANIWIRMPYTNINKIKQSESTILRNKTSAPYNFIRTTLTYDAPQDYIWNNVIWDSIRLIDKQRFDSVLQVKNIKKCNIASNYNYRSSYESASNVSLDSLLNQYCNICDKMDTSYNYRVPLFYFYDKKNVTNKFNFLKFKIMNLYYSIFYKQTYTKNKDWNGVTVMPFDTQTTSVVNRDYETDDELIQEVFSTYTFIDMDITDHHKLALEDPGWFTLYDISQAYYCMHINSESIDSIRLKIDFVGATDFSAMTPEPDERGIGYIFFSDNKKIEQIKRDGLLFHVKYKEFDNRQNIRMFFLTSAMSGLFITLIFFVIIALYKVFSRKTKGNTPMIDDKVSTEEVSEESSANGTDKVTSDNHIDVISEQNEDSKADNTTILNEEEPKNEDT